MTNRAPKQWALTKHETITSFENWRQNLEYTLSLDNEFSIYIQPGASWKKKTRENPLRGFEDDEAEGDACDITKHDYEAVDISCRHMAEYPPSLRFPNLRGAFHGPRQRQAKCR